ncbi:UNVERIFIED_CONTAM: hypothetical protein NCL1_26173 [Trichonephila clavipes]
MNSILYFSNDNKIEKKREKDERIMSNTFLNCPLLLLAEYWIQQILWNKHSEFLRGYSSQSPRVVRIFVIAPFFKCGMKKAKPSSDKFNYISLILFVHFLTSFHLAFKIKTIDSHTKVQEVERDSAEDKVN